MVTMTVSVRSLVEFLLRSGDLDNRTGMASEQVMLEGSRMHRQIQKSAGDNYEAEVPLQLTWHYAEAEGTGRQPSEDPELAVMVEGRADGIYYGSIPDQTTTSGQHRSGKKKKQHQASGSFWTINEIKTTYRRINRMRHPEPVHLAQAKCYAYIYAVQHNLERINVRMTYCNLYSNQIRYFYEEETQEGLQTWFSDLMSEYRKWAVLRIRWQETRNRSIQALHFPFPFREGQRELVAGVYRTIVNERKLFLEAPTGTGKTISTIYPALKAMGEGRAEKVFYLTAKTITRTAAEDTFALLREQHLRVRTVTLTARDKICILGNPDCNPDSCPRARGHYDRVNDAMYTLLTETDNYNRKTLEGYAERYQVCPFELGLDMSLFCDVVIGDYNYLFDPEAYLRRFFSDTVRQQPAVFLIDEAHNLLERGRSMYSAALVKEDVLTLKRKVQNLYPDLKEHLERLNRAMLQLKKRYEASGETGCLLLQEIDTLSDAAGRTQGQMEEELARERIAQMNGRMRQDPDYAEKQAVHQDFLDFYFNLSHFTNMLSLLDDHYVTYAAEDGPKKRFTVKLFCVDPSENLRKCMDRGTASILFSATFLPIQYYKSLLGGTGADYEIYARSVFREEKRGLFIVRDVTSRYQMRGPAEYDRIAECIHAVVSQRHGNYLVFLPSYSFLEAVTDSYRRRYTVEEMPADRTSLLPDTDKDGGASADAEEAGPVSGAAAVPTADTDTTIVCQNRNMKEMDREDFLNLFRDARDDHSVIGFCVLGGVFGEGIDLKNDSLIGALVVGTGIPQISGERKLLQDYFDRNGKNGYDYAYRYPGMNKVLQAAGRVIRTADDVGIVALLDDRFLTPAYRGLFPAEWTQYQETTSAEIGRLVEKFWNEWL